MDRFVVRETRAGSVGFPAGQHQQMIAFPQNTPQANMIPEAVYYEGRYGSKFPGMQLGGNVNGAGFMSIVHANGSPYPQHGINVAMSPCQGQIVSGIDPTYLASYANNSAAYIVNGDNSMRDQNSNPGFGGGYQNRSFTGADRNKSLTYSSQRMHEPIKRLPQQIQQSVQKENNNIYSKENVEIKRTQNLLVPPPYAKKKAEDTEEIKEEPNQVILTRSDKLKALHKSGPRAFSGPVEKVLKWHKALQDIGIMVIYEIVAKCVNIRRGESCAKHLVIRDNSGPAIQVDYYEVDFLLPELKPPCTVRVVGRMLAGTCRLQAFNVRPATGDDVATLPRRAAVAAHHVAKLCKEYNIHIN